MLDNSGHKGLSVPRSADVAQKQESLQSDLRRGVVELTDSMLLANARVTRRIPPFVVVSTCNASY